MKSLLPLWLSFQKQLQHIQFHKRWWSKLKTFKWKSIFSMEWIKNLLDDFVHFVLRIGTIFLILFFLTFIYRIFQDQGYVLEQFSVPQSLTEAGYDGRVVAYRIQDELAGLKTLAGSVKEDSLQLKEQGNDLDLSILGVGLSVRSLAFQMREILGKENKIIKGEITKLDDWLELKLRMTGHETNTTRIEIVNDNYLAAIDTLFRLSAEGILRNTDPYRLALIYRKEERYEEAIKIVQEILRTRPEEADWAYLAWGTVLLDQGKPADALAKYERAVQINPEFVLGWQNVSYAYSSMNKDLEGIEALKKVVELDPDNCWRYNNLAWRYFGLEEYDLADSFYLNGISITQNEIDRRDMALNWAESKLERGELTEVKRIINTYTTQAEQTTIGLITRGIVALAEEDTIQALAYVDEAFEMDPTFSYAINVSIQGAFLMKNYEKVINVYRRAEVHNMHGEQLQNLKNMVAMAHNMLQEHDEAMEQVKESIALDPSMGYPYSTLAETFAFQGELDSCFFYLEKAFILGMSTEEFSIDEPPYTRLSLMHEFQVLMKKYAPEPEVDIR